MREHYRIKYVLSFDALKIFLLACTLGAISFWLQGNIGLNLADEGFLWYGALRTAFGDVPVRDFQSYDPGRYYWAAAWLKWLGNGIISLRTATGIFQIIGLTFGLLVLRRVIRSWSMTVVAGGLLLMWMHPWYKFFDHSIAMASVYFATLLVEKPSTLRHFTAGVFVGVAAIFGRNHGLYELTAFFLLILFIWFKIDRTYLFKKMAAWGSGILIGYSPVLFMLALVPGFFESIVESVTFLLRIGSTNLPLPIPWPWGVDYSNMGRLSAMRGFFTGIFFLMLPVFYLLAGLFLLWSQRGALQQKAVLLAAVFVGLMYMHYSFSRADLEHLALGVQPMLIGIISLPFLLEFKSYFQRLIVCLSLLTFIFIMSVFSVGVATPYLVKAIAPKEEFVKVNIIGDNIWIDKNTARLIEHVQQINVNHVKPDEELLIAPHWPSFYPILQRKSPLWDIYFLFQETEEKQIKMIKELKEKNVNWVILGDVPLDERDDLRFCNTHNLLWRNFMNDFKIVYTEGLPDNYYLLHRK